MRCIVCGSEAIGAPGKVGRKIFSITSDAKICPLAAVVYRCGACGHIQKFHGEEEKRYIEKIYADYEPHLLSGGGEPLVYRASGPPVPRSFFVLEKCLPYLKKGTGRFLDVGTGNGNVLKSAGELLPGWRLAAFDIGDRYRDEVLKIPGVEKFYSGGIGEIADGDFDAITMWHSVEHMPDPAASLGALCRLLGEGGVLVVQSPDVARNPFDLSIIDHCSHFSNSSMRLLLDKAGFEIAADGSGWLYNCLTMIARPAASGGACVAAENGPRSALEYLNRVIDYFEEKTAGRRFALFGTGNASLCVYSQLSGKPERFVDEDPQKAGKVLYGVPVSPIGGVPDGSLVALPFSEEFAAGIIEKFKKAGKKNVEFLYIGF